MSASAKREALRVANPLRGFSRGERRNEARSMSGLRHHGWTFRQWWERSYRNRLDGPFPALVGMMPRPMPKHLPRLMGNGLMLHPTKGWRTTAGLPLSRYRESRA